MLEKITATLNIPIIKRWQSIYTLCTQRQMRWTYVSVIGQTYPRGHYWDFQTALEKAYVKQGWRDSRKEHKDIGNTDGLPWHQLQTLQQFWWHPTPRSPNPYPSTPTTTPSFFKILSIPFLGMRSQRLLGASVWSSPLLQFELIYGWCSCPDLLWEQAKKCHYFKGGH